MENLTRPAIETLEKALAEFAQKGHVDSVFCERCNEPIRILRKSDTVLSVECGCGLYKDNLRGL